MKRWTGVLTAMLLILVLVPAVTALAEDLSADQVKALESTGVPVYPGASYTSGDNEVATVMWFKSKDSPGQIMDWYKEKLSGWSELTTSGFRVIYKGPGGAEPKDLPTWPYVFARTTDETTGSTDSEITVRIPK